MRCLSPLAQGKSWNLPSAELHHTPFIRKDGRKTPHTKGAGVLENPMEGWTGTLGDNVQLKIWNIEPDWLFLGEC